MVLRPVILRKTPLFIVFLLHWHTLESLLPPLCLDCLGPVSLLQGLARVTAPLAVTHCRVPEQELQCQCVFPNACLVLCAEQHWPGAPWGHGVRPVPAVPGERLGHQLQVPRLQVSEGGTEVRQGGVQGWALLSERAHSLSTHMGGSGLEKCILSLVPEPRSCCSIQVYFRRWRSIVLKVNGEIC